MMIGMTPAPPALPLRPVFAGPLAGGVAVGTETHRA
jgi:hypothetical protein